MAGGSQGARTDGARRAGIEYNRSRRLRLGPNLPSSTLSRILSLVSLASSRWTRLRYRRAELRRIAPASIHPHGTAGVQSVGWVSSERDPRGSASTLLLPVGGRVSYQMVLPADARIVAECAVVVDQGTVPLATGA